MLVNSGTAARKSSKVRVVVATNLSSMLVVHSTGDLSCVMAPEHDVVLHDHDCVPPTAHYAAFWTHVKEAVWPMTGG
jgi:hypothetical protein